MATWHCCNYAVTQYSKHYQEIAQLYYDLYCVDYLMT